MTKYRTYMSVTLHSEGASASEVTDAMKKLGWVPVYGMYDYAYTWDDEWGNKGEDFDEYTAFLNSVHSNLKGLNVSYNLWTTEYGKEDFEVWECPY
jgi:hypothetical protein